MNLHATVPALYRQGVRAADVVDRSGLTTSTTAATTGGALPDDTYKVALVPRGLITDSITRKGVTGRGLAAVLADVVTSGANNAILITPSEPGDYDVYVSTDADPKWVCTVYNFEWSTTGVRTTAYGVTATSGAVAGKIKITVPGEGLAAAAYAVESTEYIYPPTEGVYLGGTVTEINTSGFEYIDFLIFFETFGETEVPELVLVPILKSTVQLYQLSGDFLDVDRYYSETPHIIEVTGGREDESFSPNTHRLRVATRGAQSVSLVIAKIAGRFASVDIHYLLN